MRNRIFSIMAAALAFAGCAKETGLPIDAGHSDYLVIKAECNMTRTDINEGHSTWDAGDVITVVYDGKAYEYVAQASGAVTTFTSASGIQNYDSSKSMTAYYPATDATGTVEIAAERTVAFTDAGQVMKSCAPLVGVPQNGNLQNGALNMVFSNIFSVLELRIDAGELAGTAKSLTIEPSDASDFNGYLTATGTVDPATMAVTTSAVSNVMKIVFPADADPKKAMTLKLPVGRFTTQSGLKVTLETSEGTFPKAIYKSGLTSYVEKDGVYEALHLAKPMYAFEAVGGGIRTADDLVAFAAAVNAGESYADWMNEEGKVVLLNDIDMSGVTSWTPIGTAVYSWASHTLTCKSGKPFTGYFDGQGYSIKNLKMKTTSSEAGAAYGFFGGLGEGAVVENLVFDSSCSLEVAVTASSDCGMLAGMVSDATLRNITNNAEMKFTGECGARVTIGIVGFAFAENTGTLLENITNTAAITAGDGGSAQNGAAGIHVSGILGFSTNHSNSTKTIEVKGCVNRGNLESASARTSGIVAASNRYTVIRNCENYGNNLNSFSKKTDSSPSGASAARIGNITCITGPGSAIYDTTNYGDVISVNSGAVSGIICLVNDASNVFENVANYGRIITDREVGKYCGVFFGSCNKAATFKNCIAGGSFGTYNNGEYQMTELTADNYWTYVGQIGSSASGVTQETIKFGTRP